MASPMTNTTALTQQRRAADTEIAVLQNQMANLDDRVSEVKSEMKEGMREIHVMIEKSNEKTSSEIKNLGDRSEKAHKTLEGKINNLEKWRWMIMGAGIVLGSIGWDLFSSSDLWAHILSSIH